MSIDMAIAPLNLNIDESATRRDLLDAAYSRGSSTAFQSRRHHLRTALNALINDSSLEEEDFGYSFIVDDEGTPAFDLYTQADEQYTDEHSESGLLDSEDVEVILSGTRCFKTAVSLPPARSIILDQPIEFQTLTGSRYIGRFDLSVQLPSGGTKHIYLDLEPFVAFQFRAKQQLVWQMGSQIGLAPEDVWCMSIYRSSSVLSLAQLDLSLLRATDTLARMISIASQIEGLERAA